MRTAAMITFWAHKTSGRLDGRCVDMGPAVVGLCPEQLPQQVPALAMRPHSHEAIGIAVLQL